MLWSSLFAIICGGSAFDPNDVAHTISVDSSRLLCLELPDGDATNGNELRVWNCTGWESQQWLFKDGAIHYALDTSKCVDAGDMQKGTVLKIWDCLDSQNQAWEYDRDDHQFQLSDREFARKDNCMDLTGQQEVRGTPVQIWTCDDSYWNQRWALQPGSNIRPVQDVNLCLDLKLGINESNTPIQLWTCHGNRSQLWTWSSEDSLLRYAASPEMCIDSGVDNASMTLQLCDTRSTSQLWGYDSEAKSFAVQLDHVLLKTAHCMTFRDGLLGAGVPVDIGPCSGCWHQGVYAFGQAFGQPSLPAPAEPLPRNDEGDEKCPARRAGGYDEHRAHLYAKLAAAAYCDDDVLSAWNCYDCDESVVSSVTICSGFATRAFVGLWEGKGLVSFEGTATTKGWLEDADEVQALASWDVGCHGCKVHVGFQNEWNSLKSCVMEALKTLGVGIGSPIRTTGHSLGASLNAIAMVDLTQLGWTIEESYDFGRPRAGDARFAQALTANFPGRVWRVTHGQDPIPNLPTEGNLSPLPTDDPFYHAEPEVWYPGDMADGHQFCYQDYTEECVEAFGVDFMSQFGDHGWYMDVIMGYCGESASRWTVV